MRGKARKTKISRIFPGITPAYAGKSAGACNGLCRVPGSPPPMRGKGRAAVENMPDFGITPAYAGKSIGKHSAATTTQDHPRLCGEKTKKIPKQRYFFHQPASFSFSLQYT